MARYEHLKIFQCAYLLVLEIYKITKNFDREFKYTLGEKLKSSSHDLLDVIRKANSLPNKEKVKLFEEIDFVTEVRDFDEAARRIESLMRLVNWEGLNAPVTRGSGTTQNGQHRVPIDLKPFLASEEHRQIILDRLGLDKDTNV